MSLVKRISTTVFSRIDQLVGEIENHDALIKATLNEQKKKLAAAKLQLSKIQSCEQRVKAQITENAQAAHTWQQRAIAESGRDENKALLCLQRKQQITQQENRLQEMVTEYRVTGQKMENDIRRCEAELSSMMQKHALMKARQSSVDAMGIIDDASQSNVENVQLSFDRWEVQLSQNEPLAPYDNNLDLLEQEYAAKENDAVLKRELADLIKNNPVENTP